ncbi:MAG TPA: PQQ-binding-like beta-propeller repeat protein [Acidimicrobiales bacterium]|nr:PQQ-binding-like beta-propeller repeat protein [Acidimicrobiales bacterium]
MLIFSRPRAIALRVSLAAGLLSCLSLAGLSLPATAAPSPVLPVIGDWTSASQSILGDRSQPLEFSINPQDVGELAPKWVFTDHGDVSATPTVADGAVYFPDWGGYLNAVNAQTGALIWEHQISSYAGEQPNQVSRNSPLIDGNELVLGDNAGGPQPGGAHLFAVNRANGNLLWNTEIDTNPAAIVTSNPVAYGNEIVVGVASNEEADAESPSYSCCSFRGAVVALNANTGQILWKTYTVPSNNQGGDSNIPCKSDNPAAGCGFTGGGVWATPTIDPLTNQVFVGTGNNYTATDAAVACANAALSADPPQSDANCTPANDYFDAVVALNLQTGQIEWGHKVEGWDAWNVACAVGFAPGATWCPSPASPDFDFGGGSPNLFIGRGPNGRLQTLVGDGQKSGVYWAFDPANGNIVWDTLVGPGTSLGGIEWGSAYDGQRIYTAEADFGGIPYQLANNPATNCTNPSNGLPEWCGGSWAALNPQTGAIEWQTATPGGNVALGPVSEAGGVVFGASMDPGPTDPDMFALDASTGKILWSFDAGSSVNAGPAIVDGTVYWGSGYSHLGPFLPFTGNDKFYAFSLNGH